MTKANRRTPCIAVVDELARFKIPFSSLHSRKVQNSERKTSSSNFFGRNVAEGGEIYKGMIASSDDPLLKIILCIYVAIYTVIVIVNGLS